ncbi:serine-rich adhesin for platelets isoform X1 [Anopheles darlingi]|uniref:serine-rich adhesin for platelets isoform X1 n=1 Tax=Anopheles darlingi TaxID=43151 RepID=UPI002100393D|nr:serine-rich adhesin for platelets isoform X1 [Anopheles darlingi]XP_049532014.1 serine-rich adhesin for platelets isoform X1 [Anopheles darlingi]XP_049532015.1 serine-rich adhesin for platelets isoform X1 [Anopheles darlingi]XP_049532016.1 serine-rich adhesin for platelets isoform X1 [Anopheles darlingi]
MINLSTTAPSHAYACRTGGTSNVVISPNGDMRQHLSGTSARTAVGFSTVGGLELLEQGFAGINGFRNNRFQYEIPTVGQHYGNAFNVGDDDEGDELPETIIDQQHDGSATISEAESIADSGTQYLDDLLEEQYLDEDDDEDDVQMSPAVEVISIDPNCNYDTDEDGNAEEHKVSLTVAMTHAMRSRSASNSSCSTSKRSGLQSNDDSSSDEQENDDEESSAVDCGGASDDANVGAFYVPNFERPPQQLLAAAAGQRPPHGRRKRSSHSQRQSFSMPHSPVGAGEIDGLLGNLPAQTSFSFEDLDSIVSQFSPVKRSIAPPTDSKTDDDDDLVDELLEDAANFNLTAYITGEDESSTSCDVVGFYNENKRSKIDSAPSNGPRKTLPKSRGKEIQALRMLMLPEKHVDQANDLQHSTKTGRPTSTAGDVVNQRADDHEKLPEKRSCTAKVKRILAPEDSGSDTGEDDENTFSGSLPDHIFAKERRSARNAKRKALDDTEKDPTWNPNGVTVPRPSKAEPKLHAPKSTASNGATGSTSSQSNVDTNGSKISSTATNVKSLKFGADNIGIKKKEHTTERSSGVTTVVPASHKGVSREHIGSSKKDVLRKKTNVKLDHDYCSPKHVGQSGGVRNGDGPPGSNGLRRAIEIPFLLPTKEQQRQKRKMLKDKKRNERTRETKDDSQRVGEPTDSGEDKQTKHGGRVTEADNRGASAVMMQKHKTVLSGEQPAPVTASSLSSPSSSRSSSAVRSVACMRSNVNTLTVSKSGTVGVGGAAANLVQPTSVATESAVVSAPPNASTGGCVKRPQQISLLKINQTTAKPDTSHVSVPAVDTSSAQKRPPQSTSSVVISSAGTKGPHDASPQSSISSSTGGSAKEVTVVRKKLNLQEYKKRRELPTAAGSSDNSSSTGNNGYSSSVNGNTHSLAVVATVADANGTETPTNTPQGGELANGIAGGAEGGVVGSVAAPQLAASATTSPETGIFKATPEGAAKLKALAIAGRLDPITAAQQKALRMQQLKKEAAIKSNEAKINLKTMPLRPIVPLAEITRLQFDESGNPVPVGETNGAMKNDDRDAAAKLHDDYEEIIIVSIGCNTAVSIASVENESIVGSNSRQESKCNVVGVKKEGKGVTEEASLLAANLSDTVKRCGLPSVQKMSGSTLIESIQEMVIKKSNTKSTNTAASSVANTVTASYKSVQDCKDDVAVTEKAVTLKKENPMVGGACSDVAASTGDQKAQYLVNQYSPYVGVSPPSSFSPGKPERAHISTSQASAMDTTQQQQHHKVKSTTIKTEEPAISIDRTTGESSASVETIEHGEDKVIMHLRKDRQRSQRSDVGVQTEPSSRFPPLQKLSTVAGGLPAANGCGPKEQKRSERAQSSSRQYGGSDEESDAKPSDSVRHHSRRSGSRTKVRAKYSKDRSHSRHRSTVRHSSSSGSRSRSRSSCYSRAHREDDRRQRSKCSRSASRSSGRYSRSRRRSSRTSSRSSRSSCYGGGGERCSSAGDRRSLSSSSTSSMSSSGSTREGRHLGRRPSHSRSRSRSRSRMRLSTSPDHRNHHHSRELPVYRRQLSPERKIVYVGKLEANIHKEDLQKKFEPYGKVLKITLHTKDNGCRYGFVTYEKPQQAYHAIDASATDPALKDYDVSFGGRRAFCRTQYADLDGELSVDQDYHMPYFALESTMLQRPSPIMNYSSSMCHAESLHGHSGMSVRGAGRVGSGGDTFEDLLMQFKKGIGAMKPRKI